MTRAPREGQHPEHDEPARQQRQRARRRAGAGSCRPRRTGSTSRTGTSSERCSSRILTGKLTVKAGRDGRRATTSRSPSTSSGTNRTHDRSPPRPTAHRSRRRPSLASVACGRAAGPVPADPPGDRVITAILGYPLYQLVVALVPAVRPRRADPAQGRRGSASTTTRSVLHDDVFWDTLLRTVVFTAANVALDDRCSAR